MRETRIQIREETFPPRGRRTFATENHASPPRRHRHPAAADDCAAALRYLAAASDRFSAAHVAGASAGANLAIVTAAAAPRLGITVASLFAVSPFVDPRAASASYAANANCHIAAPSWLAASWDAYVGPGPEAKERALADWRACPHSAVDTWRDAQDRPVAPPPTIIVTDTADPLRDEGLATARSIRDAGCRDMLHLEGSASHCFTLKLYPAKRAEALAKWVGYFVSG